MTDAVILALLLVGLGPPRARLRAPSPRCPWLREKSLAEVATCTAPTPRTR